MKITVKELCEENDKLRAKIADIEYLTTLKETNQRLKKQLKKLTKQERI